MKTSPEKIGAVLYFIWGLLHLKAAFSVYQLGASMNEGMVQGRIYQDAWSLLFFALIAMVVAVKYNWRNDQKGYWINFITVSVTDIGFIVFVLIPGYLPIFPGILGPLFWVLGVLFSTIGITRSGTLKT